MPRRGSDRVFFHIQPIVRVEVLRYVVVADLTRRLAQIWGRRQSIDQHHKQSSTHSCDRVVSIHFHTTISIL